MPRRSFRWFSVLLALSLCFSTTLPVPIRAEAAVAYKSFQPLFVRGADGSGSTLIIQNLQNEVGALSLDFVRADGSVAYTSSETIAPLATIQVPSPANLPAGQFAVVLSSSVRLSSLVRNYDQASKLWTFYPGIIDTNTLIQYFGPFSEFDSLILQNTDYTTATYRVDLYNLNGQAQPSFTGTLPVGGWTQKGRTEFSTPAGFTGMAVVVSDQRIAAVHAHSQMGDAGTPVVVDHSLAPPPSLDAWLPRALRSFDEGAGPRTTKIFVGNPNDYPAAATVTYFDQAGDFSVEQTFNFESHGSKLVDLSSLTALPSPGLYTVSITSLQPLIINEVTTFDSPGPVLAAGFPAVVGSGFVEYKSFLPETVKQSNRYSIVYVVNPSATEAAYQLDLLSPQGNLVTSVFGNVPQSRTVAIDLRQIDDLGDNFTGYAVLSTNQPVSAQVDEFYQPCELPRILSLTRSPSGQALVGDTLTFSTDAAGDGPLSYTWTLNSTPVGSNSSSWSQTFDQPGSYTVGMAVTSSCGTVYDSLTFTVQAPQTDLSTSQMMVNLSNVEEGDLLEYSLVLRNSGTSPADASLLNPLPQFVEYVAGSAQASDGSPVTVVNSVLSWDGPVLPGSPVYVTYQVRVTGSSIGSLISNTANLQDVTTQRLTVLKAASTINPGFRLSINQGAFGTTTTEVDLSFSWDSAAQITTYQISNDAGFYTGADTSAWLPVDPADPTHKGWVLAASGHLWFPRTVYMRFRAADGKLFGPFSDDILYDPHPPRIVKFEVTELPAERAAPQAQAVVNQAGSSVRYLIRVEASDADTGPAEIQVSRQPDFSSLAHTLPYSGQQVTEFIWSAPQRGPVYVRVIDYAGNPSPAEQFVGGDDWLTYLPMLGKGGGH